MNDDQKKSVSVGAGWFNPNWGIVRLLLLYVLGGPLLEIAMIRMEAPRGAFDAYHVVYSPLASLCRSVPALGGAYERYGNVVSEWTAEPLPPP